jgi:hypothetical protein
MTSSFWIIREAPDAMANVLITERQRRKTQEEAGWSQRGRLGDAAASQGRWQPLQLEEGRKEPRGLQREPRPATPRSDADFGLWPPELREDNFLLF